MRGRRRFRGSCSTRNSERDPDRQPWAIRVKLLRKLRTARFREHVTDADADASALVIGEPECPKEYPRLYGARREAEAVCTCLTQPGALDKNLVNALISAEVSQVGSNARTVVNALFEKPWRIVHIAGHGMPGVNGQPGGVVLSNGTFLGPDEIRNMRQVPELVFVNCCHLASGDADQLLNYDRASFASGVAGALIEIGVRCVIAAGWAVDDDAASVFAETFYGSLLRGSRFIDAVGDARKAAYERSRACEHMGGLPVLRRSGLGVPAKGAGPQSIHRTLGRGLLWCGLGAVADARTRADRRPDQVSRC